MMCVCSISACWDSSLDAYITSVAIPSVSTEASDTVVMFWFTS